MGPSPDSNSRLERLVEEFTDRRNRGENPDWRDYALENADLADAIHKVFPALAALGVTTTRTPQAPPRKELGEYRLLRQLGRGGMGVVYEAEQKSLGRHVALKVLPPSATLDDRFLARFQLEAQAAARLQHTNIVPVIGIGEDDGIHYYTMHYVDGHGLDAAVQSVRESLDLERRREPEEGSLVYSLLHGQLDGSSLEDSLAPIEPRTPRADASETAALPQTYLRNVAGIGLDLAQALAYAHANGVLHRDIKPSNVLLDGRGRPWITDFGLCKTGGSDLTQSGDLVGTLRYMPPERFSGTSDVRGDVYGLGITLYEMLTLQPAYEDGDRAELLRKVTQESPRRPRSLNKRIPRDLECIVLKAIARAPEERYATAEAMAQDLRAYLEDRPISARTPSLRYMLTQTAKRHRKLGAMIATFVLALAAITVVYVTDLHHKEADSRFRSYTASIAASEAATRYHDSNEAQKRLDEAPDEHRGWEWHHLRSRVDDSTRDYETNSRVVADVAYSPDGEFLVGGSSGETRVFSVENGEVLAVLTDELLGDAVAWSPDGVRVAIGGYTGRVIVWDWRKNAILFDIHEPGRIRTMNFSPAGTRLVVGRDTGALVVYDATTGETLRSLDAGSGVISMTRDDRRGQILCGLWDGRIIAWDLATWEIRWEQQAHSQSVASVAVNGPGMLASSGAEKTIKLWNAEDGEAVRALSCGESIGRLCFDPDDRRLAGVFRHRTIQVWDVYTSEVLYTLHGHSRGPSSIDWHPGGSRLATGSFGGSLKEWDVSSPRDPSILKGHMDDVLCLDFHPDDERLVSGGIGGVIMIWQPTTGHVVRTLLGHEGAVSNVQYSPDGSWIASSSWDGTVRIWNPETAREIASFDGDDGYVHDLAIMPDGRLVTGTQENTVRIWDRNTGESSVIGGHEAGVWSVAVSHDGSRIASGDYSGVVKVWDARTLELLFDLVGHENEVHGIAFSHDGSKIATASVDETLRLWDARTGAQLAQLVDQSPDLGTHTEALENVAFMPGDQRLICTGRGGFMRVWDLERQELVLYITGLGGWVQGLVVSDNGERVATGSGGALIRIFDVHDTSNHAGVRRQSQAARRRLQEVVASVRRESDNIDDAIRMLENDTDLGTEDRETALQIAHGHRGEWAELITRTRESLMDADAPTIEHRYNRSLARGIHRAVGHCNRYLPEALTNLAYGELRAGSAKTAAAWLRHAARLHDRKNPDLRAIDLAGVVLAHDKLGESGAARAAFSELEAHLALHPEVSDSAHVRSTTEEARNCLRDPVVAVFEESR